MLDDSWWAALCPAPCRGSAAEDMNSVARFDLPQDCALAATSCRSVTSVRGFRASGFLAAFPETSIDLHRATYYAYVIRRRFTTLRSRIARPRPAPRLAVHGFCEMPAATWSARPAYLDKQWKTNTLSTSPITESQSSLSYTRPQRLALQRRAVNNPPA